MPSAPVQDVFVPAPRFNEFEGCTRQTWLDTSPSSRGHKAWLDFQKSIHAGNRTIPRRLALSHWHSVEDFVWISENLPNLTELDLSDIQDCFLVDHTTDALDCYTWEELRHAVKDKFWDQIEKLWVRHWGCTALQNSLFRHPSAGGKSSELDYRSRRDGQTRESVCDVTTIIGACSKLKVLSVRGPTVGGGLNKAWHPKKACIEEGGHAHFCALVEGLEDTAPLSMETLELHQAEIGLLPQLLAKSWTLKRIKISLAPILSRYAPGRIQEDVEDPKLGKWPKEIASRYTKDNCRQKLQDKRLAGVSEGERKQKLHEWLDSAISMSFEAYPWKNPGVANKLQALWNEAIRNDSPNVDLSALYSYFLMNFHTSGPYAHPVRALAYDFDFIAQAQKDLERNSPFTQLTTTDSAEACNDIPISPFTFILPDHKIQSADEIERITKDYKTIGAKFELNSIFLPLHESYPTEPMRPIDMWNALRKTAPGFAPLWDLDALMSFEYPANQGIVAPTGAFVDSIVRGLLELKRNGIPVRVLLAWRKQAPGLYWGHEHLFAVAFGSRIFGSEHFIPSSSLTDGSGSSSGTFEEDAQQKTTRTCIAKLVDELVIRYPDWTGGAPRNPEDAGPAPEAKELAKRLDREAQGWQRWWYRNALLFTSLRRLDIHMPEAFDAFHSKRLALVLLGEGDDERTKALKGKWHLRHNSTSQGTYTRFISRIWERVGGDDQMRWTDDKWKQTAETFRDLKPFDEDWAGYHAGRRYKNWRYKTADEHTVDLNKSEETDTAMNDDTAPKVEGVAPEIAPSKSPEDVVETIETTDMAMHETPEVLQAESVDDSSPPAVQKIESLSAEPEPAGPDSAGSEGKSFDSLFVEASTSNAIDPWNAQDEQLHRATLLVDASRSGEQEYSSDGLSKQELLAPPDSVVTSSSGRASNAELLVPSSAEIISGSSGGSTNKPMPRVRSRSRGRGERKATPLSRSAESSRERRSKRQASQEPDGPQPPTQRRRSKMERELDWSLKK